MGSQALLIMGQRAPGYAATGVPTQAAKAVAGYARHLQAPAPTLAARTR